MGYGGSRALRLLVAERAGIVLSRYANQPITVDAARSVNANEAKVFNVVTKATWRTVADRYGSLRTDTI